MAEDNLFQEAVKEVKEEKAQELKEQMKDVYSEIVSNTERVEGYVEIRKQQIAGLDKSLNALKEVKTQADLDKWNEEHSLAQYEPYHGGVRRNVSTPKKSWVV